MKAGYLVMESCEDYEQALALVVGDNLPPGGILDWSDSKKMRTMFPSREAARAAIARTENYRLAFGRTDLPERKLCSVVPVALAAIGAAKADTGASDE